jgi:hypothetical protein
MALTADQEALLAQLLEEKNAPAEPEKPAFNSVEEVVRELVRRSDKFTADPEVRDAAISFLDGAIKAAAEAV